jgi:hypothetical protein
VLKLHFLHLSLLSFLGDNSKMFSYEFSTARMSSHVNIFLSFFAPLRTFLTISDIHRHPI